MMKNDSIFSFTAAGKNPSYLSVDGNGPEGVRITARGSPFPNGQMGPLAVVRLPLDEFFRLAQALMAEYATEAANADAKRKECGPGLGSNPVGPGRDVV